jgi:hypothetical protein
MMTPLAAAALGAEHLGRYIRIPVAGRPPLSGHLAAVTASPGAPVLIALDCWSWHNPTAGRTRHLLSPTDTVEVSS